MFVERRKIPIAPEADSNAPEDRRQTCEADRLSILVGFVVGKFQQPFLDHLDQPALRKTVLDPGEPGDALPAPGGISRGYPFLKGHGDIVDARIVA